MFGASMSLNQLSWVRSGCSCETHNCDAFSCLLFTPAAGFVLRCFKNLYDFDLVEKATFLAWREEVDQNYPAKGQALFEVNCLHY